MSTDQLIVRRWGILIRQLQVAIARGDRAAELIILGKLRWPQP